MVLSTACVVGRGPHHMEQASLSHTLCYHPKHGSGVTLLASSPYPQMILAFSKTWLRYDAVPDHSFKMHMAAL